MSTFVNLSWPHLKGDCALGGRRESIGDRALPETYAGLTDVELNNVELVQRYHSMCS